MNIAFDGWVSGKYGRRLPSMCWLLTPHHVSGLVRRKAVSEKSSWTFQTEPMNSICMEWISKALDQNCKWIVVKGLMTLHAVTGTGPWHRYYNISYTMQNFPPVKNNEPFSYTLERQFLKPFPVIKVLAVSKCGGECSLDTFQLLNVSNFGRDPNNKEIHTYILIHF